MSDIISEREQKLAELYNEVNMRCCQDLLTLRRDILRSFTSSPTPYSHGEGIPVLQRGGNLRRIAAIYYENHINPREVAYEMLKAMRSFTVSNCLNGQSQVFVIHGSRETVTLSVGVDSREGGEYTMIAAFPGVKFESAAPLESIMAEKRHIGLMTGVPHFTHRETEPLYSLDVFLRGMRGKEYAVIIAASPCDREETQRQLDNIHRLIGENHQDIRQSISKSFGESIAKTMGFSLTSFGSWMQSSSVTDTTAKTTANTYNGSAGINLGIAHIGASVARTIAESTAHAVTEAAGMMAGAAGTTSYSVTRTKNKSIANTEEQLNRFAYAYEEALLVMEDRYKQALDEGLWRSVCYIAAPDKETFKTASALFCSSMSTLYDSCEPFRIIPLAKAIHDPLMAISDFPMLGVDNLAAETLMTSSELASLIALPQESHPGIEIRSTPRFSVQPPALTPNGMTLGHICDREVPLANLWSLNRDELSMHALVTGMTGMGKTTTIRHMLMQAGVPYLVLEPAKSEYRRIPGIRVYTAGDPSAVPFCMNPFELSPGDSLHSHVDSLAAILNAAFPMEGPMSALVERGLLRTYEDCGWDVHQGVDSRSSRVPTMDDFYSSLEKTIDDSGLVGEYGCNIRNALLTRIGTLRRGSRGQMFNSELPFNAGDLLRQPTVIEMKHVGNDETKAFLSGLVMLRVYKHMEKAGVAGHLKHLLVIEEAHRIFRRSERQNNSIVGNNTAYHTVRIFENMMAEVRAYGLGIIIADQQPLKLSDGAVKNTNLKIIHRLAAREDALAMGGGMGLEDAPAEFITRLPRGEALVHCASMREPAHLKLILPECEDVERTDSKLREQNRNAGLSRNRPEFFETNRRKLLKLAPAEYARIASSFVLSMILLGGDRHAKIQSAWAQSIDDMQNLFRVCLGGPAHSLICAHLLHAAVMEILKNKAYLRKVAPELQQRLLQQWDRIALPDALQELPKEGISQLRAALLSEDVRKHFCLPLWHPPGDLSTQRLYAEASQIAAAICVSLPEVVRLLKSKETLEAAISGVANFIEREVVQKIDHRGATCAQFGYAVLIALMSVAKPYPPHVLNHLRQKMEQRLNLQKRN